MLGAPPAHHRGLLEASQLPHSLVALSGQLPHPLNLQLPEESVCSPMTGTHVGFAMYMPSCHKQNNERNCVAFYFKKNPLLCDKLINLSSSLPSHQGYNVGGKGSQSEGLCVSCEQKIPNTRCEMLLTLIA